MPSSIGHALVATAIGAPLAPAAPTRRYWIAGVLCAVLPDLDAVGHPFGWGDLGFLGGHRALSHSISFKIGKQDRKSTRLNSSHTVISYAVFCLKKKKKTTDRTQSKSAATAPTADLPTQQPPRQSAEGSTARCEHKPS